MLKYIFPPLVKNVRHIITVSEYSRRRIVEEFNLPVSKVTAIPLAADKRFSPVGQSTIEEFKIANNLPERYILFVGGFEKRKNLARLLNAWQAWHDKPIELRLLVLGGGNKVSGVGKYENVPKGVIFLGRLDDQVLPSLYASAEAFVYPSLYEGFGLPPLEAMASGVPVITSSITSLPEVVGDAAIKVDPYSVEDIKNAMRRIVNDKELGENMRYAGIIRSLMYDWDYTASATFEILRSVSEGG